jgi:hypothetical protein
MLNDTVVKLLMLALLMLLPALISAGEDIDDGDQPRCVQHGQLAVAINHARPDRLKLFRSCFRISQLSIRIPAGVSYTLTAFGGGSKDPHFTWKTTRDDLVELKELSKNSVSVIARSVPGSHDAEVVAYTEGAFAYLRCTHTA